MRRTGLLFLCLGLAFFLISCTHSSSDDADLVQVKPMPDAAATNPLNETSANDTTSQLEVSSDAEVQADATVEIETETTGEISRQFMTPSTVPSPGERVSSTLLTLQPTSVLPQTMPVGSTEIVESWSLQDLGHISESVFTEINSGRQDASLEPLAWDVDLETQAKSVMESLYSQQTLESLDSLQFTDGYLIFFSSDIQLGETELINRFIELLNSDNSLRAGLFDDRFTRIGISSGLSHRPETEPSYVYLCHINPAAESQTTVVPPETEYTSAEESANDTDPTSSSDPSASTPAESEPKNGVVNEAPMTNETGTIASRPSGTSSGEESSSATTHAVASILELTEDETKGIL